jgi:hypothetical protein
VIQHGSPRLLQLKVKLRDVHPAVWRRVSLGGTAKLSAIGLGEAGAVGYLAGMTTHRDPLYAGYRYPAEPSVMRSGCISGSH